MKQNNHTEQINTETERLFSGASIDWGESKEMIWDEKFEKIYQQPETKIIRFNQRIIVLAAAASIILLVGFGSLGWFYSNTIECSVGNHLTASLPDGSSVEMNAESTLKFHPYRWYFQRNLQFEGEGFFSVQKGKKFTVNSQMGETAVLGTTFNIFSRNDTYRVFCQTGRVNVKSSDGESVILTPNQQAVIKSGKLLKEEHDILPENVISWRNNQFLFTSAPFNEVIKEIERQYNITISTEKTLTGTISVSFQKEPDVENILSMVCKPLGYKYVKKSDKNYVITGNN